MQYTNPPYISCTVSCYITLTLFPSYPYISLYFWCFLFLSQYIVCPHYPYIYCLVTDCGGGKGCWMEDIWMERTLASNLSSIVWGCLVLLASVQLILIEQCCRQLLSANVMVFHKYLCCYSWWIQMSSCVNWELVDAGLGLDEVAGRRIEQKILQYLKVSFPLFMKGRKNTFLPFRLKTTYQPLLSGSLLKTVLQPWLHHVKTLCLWGSRLC